MEQTGISRAVKILAIGAGAIFALLFLRELPFDEYGLALLRSIESWGPLAPLVCVLIYILWVLLLLPGSVMTVGAGILFGTWGIPVAVIGGLCSSTAAFLIARYCAHARVIAWVRKSERAGILDRAIQEGGWGVVFFSRLSPIVPYNITNYFFGITSVSFRTYFTATLAGMLPGTILYAYAGSLGHQILAGEQEIGWVHYIFLAGGLIATGALGVHLQRKLQEVDRRRREELSTPSSEAPDKPDAEGQQ